MAITLLLGPPGAGKSYEATVFQVLPALQDGRKVITNLPLNLDAFAKIDPLFRGLIQVVKASKDNLKPFSTMADYADPWRHPDTGTGPLYVIDECHIPLPRGGTSRDIEEWFSLHRHEVADVILITQSYGKVSKSIIDLVQTTISLRKNTNLGQVFNKTYRRAVRDGLRKAETVHQEVRRYNPKYFPLYQSYTRGKAGQEASVKDVKPFYRHWVVYALGAVLAYLAYMLLTHGNPFGLDRRAPSAPVSSASGVPPSAVVPSAAPLDPPSPVAPAAAADFKTAFGRFVVAGRVGSAVLFRDGPRVVTSDDLLRRGVRVWAKEVCLVTLAYRGESVDVRCP